MRKRRDPTSFRWRMAARFGPERVALVLSLVVVVAFFVLLRPIG